MDCEAWEATLLARRSATAPFVLRNFSLAKRLSAFLMVGACLCCTHMSLAQQPPGEDSNKTSLPDSPKPQDNTNTTTDTTTRFIGYMTNKSFVFPAIAVAVGVMLGRLLGFSVLEALWPMVAFSVLAAVAPQP